MNLEPIDTSTTAGKAEVMQLAAEGRQLLVRPAKTSDSWEPIHECAAEWGWRECEYAIQTEPVGPDVVWVEFDRYGGLLNAWSTDIGSGIPERKMVRYVRADQ